MQSKAATIREYLESLPPDRRVVIELLDREVRAGLPRAAGSMKYGMPTYQAGDRMVAFNAQKHYFSFYASPEHVKQHKAELTGLDVGKSCIRFRNREQLPLAVIRKIIAAYGREGLRRARSK